MKNTFKITLKANEKIYVNGAVVRTDRKVSLEFLNDVQFLLESHVLQPEAANSPLRQLYFIVQVMLMTPQQSDDALDMFRRSLPLLLVCFDDEQMRATLKHVDRLVNEGHIFEALKAIRNLYALEETFLAASDRQSSKFPLAAAE